jgi:ferredoxin, 2Fe-2S
MHMKRTEGDHPPATVPVTFILQDPHAITGKDERQLTVLGVKGESILETAMDNGINIEHSCGGVCACSTCHVYLNSGDKSVSEAEDDELDRVEEAPDLKRNSRLSCQMKIIGDGPIQVEVPAWNRNAVKEKPH